MMTLPGSNQSYESVTKKDPWKEKSEHKLTAGERDDAKCFSEDGENTVNPDQLRNISF